MPIDKKKYHPDWQNIRNYALKRANNTCESCGIKQHAINKNGKKVYLNVCHINGNLWNNKKENLKVMCPSCHMKHDRNKKKK